MPPDARPPGPTRILLADDHAVVRRGLRLVLDAEPDLTVVAEADDGLGAIEEALRTECDLAVLDVSMPQRSHDTDDRDPSDDQLQPGSPAGSFRVSVVRCCC